MNKRKRLSRLEKLAGPLIERVKKEDEAAHIKMRLRAEIHSLNFAALVIYGCPKLEEPLSEAWARCTQSSIWEKFDYPGGLLRMTPFHETGAERIGKYLCDNWMPSLPGNTDTEKLEQIFLQAERWLIWFTFADWTANVLKFALPDLSKMKKFDRSIAVLRNWPCLPAGKFELRARQGRFDGPNVSPVDLEFWEKYRFVADELNRLERKRFNAIDEELANYLEIRLSNQVIP